jgi:hypothetical protein
VSISRTEAIKRFLEANTHSDLANLYSLGMEVQVNVARDDGEKETGEYKGREFVVWTDGMERWKSFRIPYNAGTEPTYEDKPMSFSLDKHAEGIGMTGWNWKEKKSIWVAFDFDSILGHSDKHNKKLTQHELDKIKEIVKNIPWVTLRKSTGGGGLHLYVFVNYVDTANHTEHAALARSILHMLSALTGYEFTSKVDVCGSNMWVWHRKMRGTDGLTLIKHGTILTDIPANWRDHMNVVSGRSVRVNMQQVGDLDMFDQLTGQRAKTPLDTEHRKLIDWLSENKAYWWWDNNAWMLVTHTVHLKKAHEALNLRGRFETIATGSNEGHDHNCFAYPLRNGSWVVRRYTTGTAEASTWQQDGHKWTRCFLNREVDVPTACQISGGIEHPNGGYYFSDITNLVEALRALRVDPELPDFIKGDRHCIIKPGKVESKIVVTINASDDDAKHPQKGWILDKKKTWMKVFNVATNQSPDEIEKNESYDDIARHVVSEMGQDCGWLVKSGNDWREEPLAHVKAALQAQGFPSKDITEIVGTQVIQAWKLVNKPFEPEYPGNREWNRNAAQLAFTPSRYSDSLEFPTWNSLLEHCGSGLNEAIAENEWCKKHSILTGGDYLKLWIASLLKAPSEPLPYLFFWSSEQNTGKSSFHIALNYLLTNGYMRADAALESSSNFNGEIEKAVVCVIEETDLKKARSAYNRIKDWVTSPQILIHIKGVTPYMRINITHWIQCANDYKFCPIFPGDTRITMIQVPVIPADKMIARKDFEVRLKNEAPDFLSYIMKVEIPPSGDRLNVPIINTKEKQEAQEQNKTAIQTFIDTECHYVEGAVVTFSDFYERFTTFLQDATEIASWSKIRVGRELPVQYPKGRLTKDVNIHIGNLAFEKGEPKGSKWFSDGSGFLRQAKVAT